MKKETGNRKLLAAGALALVTGAAAMVLPYYVGEKVIKVFDGDSFEIGFGQTIRLNRVDAPEIGRCYSEEAKKALTKLILNKRVIISEPISDRYGRIMAMVYVNGVNVNTYMIRNGYAVGSSLLSSVEANGIKEAMVYAQKNKIGVYSEKCVQKTPPNPKCTIKGNRSTKNPQLDRFYYRSDCAYYNMVDVLLYEGDQWFCTEAEAIKAGFKKSQNCK